MKSNNKCWRCGDTVKQLGIKDDAGRGWCFKCATAALASPTGTGTVRFAMAPESIIAAIGGVIVDAGNIPVPDDDAELPEAVRQLLRERDAAIARVEKAEEQADIATRSYESATEDVDRLQGELDRVRAEANHFRSCFQRVSKEKLERDEQLEQVRAELKTTLGKAHSLQKEYVALRAQVEAQRGVVEAARDLCFGMEPMDLGEQARLHQGRHEALRKALAALDTTPPSSGGDAGRVRRLEEALQGALGWLLNTEAGRAVPQVNGQPGDWMRAARAALGTEGRDTDGGGKGDNGQ